MPNVRFAVGVQRVVPFIQYHHVLMFLIAAAWTTAALLLAGCTTNTGSMHNVYLLSIDYSSAHQASAQSSSLFAQAANGGQLDVRVSYFGICVRRTSEGDWICASGASELQMILSGNGNDPLDAMNIAARFKNDVIFPGLLIGGIAMSILAFVLLSTFPSWHEEHDIRTGSDIDVKPFPSRAVSQVVLFTLTTASLFLLVSALWQHIAAASAASTITTTTQTYLSTHVGPVAIALGWLSFALIILPTMGVLVMIISIQLLDRLTDE